MGVGTCLATPHARHHGASSAVGRGHTPAEARVTGTFPEVAGADLPGEQWRQCPGRWAAVWADEGGPGSEPAALEPTPQRPRHPHPTGPRQPAPGLRSCAFALSEQWEQWAASWFHSTALVPHRSLPPSHRGGRRLLSTPGHQLGRELCSRQPWTRRHSWWGSVFSDLCV